MFGETAVNIVELREEQAEDDQERRDEETDGADPETGDWVGEACDEADADGRDDDEVVNGESDVPGLVEEDEGDLAGVKGDQSSEEEEDALDDEDGDEEAGAGVAHGADGKVERGAEGIGDNDLLSKGVGDGPRDEEAPDEDEEDGVHE